VGPDRSLVLSAPALFTDRAALRRAEAVAAVAALTILALASPFRLCLVATLFHVPCPGCGLTRAAFAIARRDFAGAFALHPLSLALVPMIGWMVGAHVVRYVRTGTAWHDHSIPRWTEGLAAGIALLLVGVWVARFCGLWGGPVSV